MVRTVALVSIPVALLVPAALPEVLGLGSIAAAEKKVKSSPAVRKALQEAKNLIGQGQTEQAIAKLRSILTSFPADPACPMAREALLDLGAGEEVLVKLEKREVFRDKLKITERRILELEEKILKDLRERYKPLKRFVFKDNNLTLFFYDSQMRYRQKGGLITSSGHYGTVKEDRKTGFLSGKIEWYYTHAANPTDFEIGLRAILYHETTHYVNKAQFGGAIPQVLEEGLATFFASRLCTEQRLTFLATERQERESTARKSLNLIQKYDDFLSLLDAPRALGRGDETLDRWYSICYSIVDFIEEGQIGGRKASAEKLLKLLEKKLDPDAKKEEAGAAGGNAADPEEAAKGKAKEAVKGKVKGRPKAKAAEKKQSLTPTQEFFRSIIEELYGVKLDIFHQALKTRIGTYKVI
jgi:hypothetical protein